MAVTKKYSAHGHELSLTEAGAIYRDADGREFSFPYSSLPRVRYSPWRRTIWLKVRAARAPISWLPAADQLAFLTEFFRGWQAVDPAAAKKAAFDYAEEKKSFHRLTLAICLLFSLPLSVALFNDSWEQTSCTGVLQQNSVGGEMQVTKFRKKRKGHYILTLSFTAPNGEVIEGTDQLITQDESMIPKSVPVVYSPERPRCWSLTPNLTGTEVNWAKRRYFAAFTFLFGLFFFSLTIFGLQWSIGHLLRPAPFRPELRALFTLT